MKRAAFALVVAPALALMAARPGPAKSQSDSEKSLTSLVEAERSFSRTSEEKGIREAFLAFLAEKAIVFRPKPVEGRPVYEKMAPDDPAVLTWEPEVAEVSAAGDLGYTSGPYKLKRDKTEKASESYGHYVSVWEKQADGTWLVIRDIGIDHGRPPKPPLEVLPIPPSGLGAALSSAAAKKLEVDLTERVKAFHDVVIRSGFSESFEKFATEDIRLFRQGRLPVSGLVSVKDAFTPEEGKVLGTGRFRGQGRLEFKVTINTRIAATGDLGIAHGTLGLAVGRRLRDSTSYLWIWRRKPGGGWKMCLAVQLPLRLDAKS